MAFVSTSRSGEWREVRVLWAICDIPFLAPGNPYYSPTSSAGLHERQRAVRTMRRFAVTPSNARTEARVYKVGPHTPYIIDEYELPWRAREGNPRGYRGNRVPWEHIGGMPKPATLPSQFHPHPKTTATRPPASLVSSPNITVKRFVRRVSSGVSHHFCLHERRGAYERSRGSTRPEDPGGWSAASRERTRPTNRPCRIGDPQFLGSPFSPSESIRKLMTPRMEGREDRLFTSWSCGGQGPSSGIPEPCRAAGLDSLYKNTLKFNSTR